MSAVGAWSHDRVRDLTGLEVDACTDDFRTIKRNVHHFARSGMVDDGLFRLFDTGIGMINAALEHKSLPVAILDQEVDQIQIELHLRPSLAIASRRRTTMGANFWFDARSREPRSEIVGNKV